MKEDQVKKMLQDMHASAKLAKLQAQVEFRLRECIAQKKPKVIIDGERELLSKYRAAARADGNAKLYLPGARRWERAFRKRLEFLEKQTVFGQLQRGIQRLHLSLAGKARLSKDYCPFTHPVLKASWQKFRRGWENGNQQGTIEHLQELMSQAMSDMLYQKIPPLMENMEKLGKIGSRKKK